MERKGICNNIGVCTMVGKVQIITDDDADLVCPYCGEPMEPYNDEGSVDKMNADLQKGKRKKLFIFIIVAILLLGGIGFGIYSLFGGKPEPTAIKLNFTNLTMTVGEQKQLSASLLPEKADQKVTFIYKAQKDQAYKDGKEKTKIVEADNSTGMLTAMRPGETKAQVVCKEWPKLVAVCNITVLPKPQSVPSDGQGESLQTNTVKKTPEGDENGVKETDANTPPKLNPTHGYGTVKLSYGTYTGRLSKDGKPNGTGRLKFTQSYRLNSEYMAQPGESIEGIFENGIPKIVTYYKKDGSPIKIKTR